MASRFSIRRPLLAATLALAGGLAGIVPAGASAATDGTSNTVMVAESVARPGATSNLTVVFSDILVTSLHGGGR
jgi:hypothetical protein